MPRLYRVNVGRTVEPDARIPTESYVVAETAQGALDTVVDTFDNGKAAKVVSWTIEQVATSVLIASRRPDGKGGGV